MDNQINLEVLESELPKILRKFHYMLTYATNPNYELIFCDKYGNNCHYVHKKKPVSVKCEYGLATCIMMYDRLEREFGQEKMRLAININNAMSKKVARLKKYITTLSQKPCLFLTLTFNDKVLNNSTENTRRQYVVDFLSSFNVPYCANIDYGKKNHREHYHAVIQIEKIDYSLWQQKSGAIKGQIIPISSITDNTKIAKYIAKLTNHAFKETTKRKNIIYSKCKPV